jgi:hypothetical protein
LQKQYDAYVSGKVLLGQNKLLTNKSYDIRRSPSKKKKLTYKALPLPVHRILLFMRGCVDVHFFFSGLCPRPVGKEIKPFGTFIHLSPPQPPTTLLFANKRIDFNFPTSLVSLLIIISLLE